MQIEKDTLLDCEQSLFCSKIRADERQSHERDIRTASSAVGRARGFAARRSNIALASSPFVRQGF